MSRRSRTDQGPSRTDIKLAVFDLGGTIIEDVGHVPKAFEAALRSHGYSISATEISRWRGASKRETIRRIIGEREAIDSGVSERVYHTFQESLIDLLRKYGVRPVEGVERAFARLRDANVRVAATTGFDRLITEEVLGGLDLKEILDPVVCGDAVSAGRRCVAATSAGIPPASAA